MFCVLLSKDEEVAGQQEPAGHGGHKMSAVAWSWSDGDAFPEANFPVNYHLPSSWSSFFFSDFLIYLLFVFFLMTFYESKV